MGENNKYVYSEHMTNMMKVFENSYRFMEEAMYESPIKLMETEWSTQMDGNILKAVKNVGINVDKDELLRALKYDRGQYDKGYRDGVNKVCSRIMEMLTEANDTTSTHYFDFGRKEGLREALFIIEEEMGK